MTIERQHGLIIVICDQENSARCEETLETGESEWNATMATIRKAGWRSFGPKHPGGSWIHCCPRCCVPR